MVENRLCSGSGRPRGDLTPSKDGGVGVRPPPFWMVLKLPGAAQTPKTTDFQPNPKLPSAKPPSGNRRFLQSMLCLLPTFATTSNHTGAYSSIGSPALQVRCESDFVCPFMASGAGLFLDLPLGPSPRDAATKRTPPPKRCPAGCHLAPGSSEAGAVSRASRGRVYTVNLQSRYESLHRSGFPELQTCLRVWAILVQDPGVLLKDPGVLSKDSGVPGVLLKDTGVL